MEAAGRIPPGTKPRHIDEFQGLDRATHLNKLPTDESLHCKVEPLQIQVEEGPDGFVAGFLHLPAKVVRDRTTAPNQTAAILLSGAGGGVLGPSSIYPGVSDKLASLEHGVPCLRLDYRFPARNPYCARDVKAAMDVLRDLYGLERFVLVGWSFGSAPVFTVASEDERVVGCATIAAQTAGTEGIRQLAPRPLLLIHGTADRTLRPYCSEKLHGTYGEEGDRTLKLFEGDDHALTQNAAEVEDLLCEFIISCAGLELTDTDKKVLASHIMPDGARLDMMKDGGDLAGGERQK